MDKIILRLKEGNERFKSGNPSSKDLAGARESTICGQKPFATILTCSDSRVVPEYIFDANIGELFVIRNAGNVIDEIVLGSMEYGVAHLKTPLLIVLGHEKCGAVTAACQGGECSPNIRAVMKKIESSVAKCNCDIEKTVDENMRCMIEGIRSQSQVIKELEEKGDIRIIPMKYHLTDGHVEEL